jgi:hypothetical protein
MTIYETNAQVEDQNTLLINTYFNLSSTNFIDNYGYSESNFLQSVAILQFGNNNNIDINSSGKSQQKVNQIGNNNNFQFIDFYNSSDMNLDVLQDGNNSSIQIYGVNSLMKDMLIKQSAGNQTLIITNY